MQLIAYVKSLGTKAQATGQTAAPAAEGAQAPGAADTVTK